mgnify:CR=1 FL=1
MLLLVGLGKIVLLLTSANEFIEQKSKQSFSDKNSPLTPPVDTHSPKTQSQVFQDMLNLFLEIESISKYPEIAAKLAEVMPLNTNEVRAILASRRISLESTEIEMILDIVKQNIGAV